MTISKIFTKNHLKIKRFFVFIFVPVLLVSSIFIFYCTYFFGRIYPNVYIAQVPVGGKTPLEAAQTLSKLTTAPEKIVLSIQTQTFEIPTSKIGFSYDFIQSAENAYNLTRTGNIVTDLEKRLELLFSKTQIGLTVKLDEKALQNTLSIVSSAVSINPIPFSILLKDGIVAIDRGKGGTEIDIENARLQIGNNLTYGIDSPIHLQTIFLDTGLSENQAEILKKRAEKLIGKTLILNYENQLQSYNDQSLIILLDINNKYKEDEVSLIVSKTAASINRDPENSLFVFLPNETGGNGRVQEFSPSKDGLEVNQDVLTASIIDKLKTLENTEASNATVDIPVIKTMPKIKTEEANNLGIKELLGSGTSLFQHSIPNRIYNVSLAATRLNGILIAPGEVFSFGKALGDISAYTGYLQAYVIQNGKTVLGDGGGVCQVSTTFFRALLNAGLPIAERHAHAYRVGYYEQDSPPGFDATVFVPSVDLKFKNDTGNHILVQTLIDPNVLRLTFELYGTKDGREVTIGKPVISNESPPPPDVYQDDPSLPKGQIKQVDFAAWGAKVYFTRQVTKNGEVIISDRFDSNFRPWQAVYLRGTKE